MKRRLVKLETVKMLVLDEVDRMLDMGFQPAIARIAATLPTERQTLCYSATLEGAVKEVARKYLNNPARIEIGSVLKPAENVELRTFEVEPDRSRNCSNTCWAPRQGASWFLCAPSTAPIAWRAGWSAPGIRRRRFTATARRPSATRRCAASPRTSPDTGGYRRGRPRHRRGECGACDQLRHAQGGGGLCHRVGRTGRLRRMGGFHLCGSGGTRRSAED